MCIIFFILFAVCFVCKNTPKFVIFCYITLYNLLCFVTTFLEVIFLFHIFGASKLHIAFFIIVFGTQYIDNTIFF